MPHHPYLPIGPLRTAIVFPQVPKPDKDDALKTALLRVGLPDFVDRADDRED